MTDLLADHGSLFLGSRLRRLGERMQADVAILTMAAGVDVQPNQFQFLLAIEAGDAVTVSAVAHRLGISQPAVTRTALLLRDAGLVEPAPDADDRRQRPLMLTQRGRAALTRARALVWPRVRRAADQLTHGLKGDFSAMLGEIEARLAAHSLADRATDPASAPLTLVNYDGSATHRALFKAINAEWITSMFGMEPTDEAVLNDPDGSIIAPGGAILFVSALAQGIVGTAALRRDADGAIELTKMGVSQSARGSGAGAFLLAAIIGKGVAMTGPACGMPLYLLTNKRCAAAIHLYESMGFIHCPQIMVDYGARYERCDVAMRFAG